MQGEACSAFVFCVQLTQARAAFGSPPLRKDPKTIGLKTGR
jgi:hypothetical protein